MSRDRTILDAAAEAFYEKGFHGVGVDELGKRAGLNGPALYRVFASKNEILAALFDQALDELLSATARAHDDPHADLRRLIRHHVEFTVRHRHLVSVYQREDRSLVDPWRRRFDRRRREYVERWESIIAECWPRAEATDVAAATQTALGAIFSIAYWPAKIAGTTDLAGLMVRLVTAGLSTLDSN